jgi:uncharacterized protein
MDPIRVCSLNSPTVVPEEYFLSPEKLIAGNPAQEIWQEYSDPTTKFFAGFWQSERGKWKIAYTEEEYCEILAGRSIITDANGHAVTVTTGDRFVIPRGFVGTWEVVEITRKRYVIYESAS